MVSFFGIKLGSDRKKEKAQQYVQMRLTGPELGLANLRTNAVLKEQAAEREGITTPKGLQQ